jgi:hypothetical protein
MTSGEDFERAWLAKFARRLSEVAGVEAAKQVMEGSESLSSECDPQEVIAWTKQTLEQLEFLVGREKAEKTLTGCACEYPKENLGDIRKTWEATGDIELVHSMLQERFETFLIDTLKLPAKLRQEIVSRGWGLAGIREGNKIIATKIPKSGNLLAYMEETDFTKKRRYYCHCPRVRTAVETTDAIPSVYCYCGAGFYKGIWEHILQKPVKVQVLESVLNGDEVCKIAIRLPLTLA